jgi:hypothetical protein
LSVPLFWNLTIELRASRLFKALESCGEVRVLAYVREQSQTVQSTYLTSLNHSGPAQNLSLGSFFTDSTRLNPEWADFHKVMAQWQESWGDLGGSKSVAMTLRIDMGAMSSTISSRTSSTPPDDSLKRLTASNRKTGTESVSVVSFLHRLARRS